MKCSPGVLRLDANACGETAGVPDSIDDCDLRFGLCF